MRRGAFFRETFALKDAEAVLFVNDDQAEAREADRIFDERVSANDEFRLPRFDAAKNFGFLAGSQTADEQFDAVAGGGEDPPRGEIVLRGKNFCRSHQGNLASVFD